MWKGGTDMDKEIKQEKFDIGFRQYVVIVYTIAIAVSICVYFLMGVK